MSFRKLTTLFGVFLLSVPQVFAQDTASDESADEMKPLWLLQPEEKQTLWILRLRYQQLRMKTSLSMAYLILKI